MKFSLLIRQLLQIKLEHWDMYAYLECGLQYSNIFPVLENMTTPTCASHSMASSFAFLRSPPRLLEKVTWRFVGFSILLISIFPRPIEANVADINQRYIDYMHKKSMELIIKYKLNLDLLYIYMKAQILEVENFVWNIKCVLPFSWN